MLTTMKADSPEKTKKADDKLIVCICCFIICFLFIILLATFLLLYGHLFPLSRYIDSEFQVDSAFISSLNMTTPAELTATWDITLLAINSDDKFIVEYDVVQVWLYYGRSTEANTFVLATTILPPFVLNPTRNQTKLSFKLATLRAYVGDDVVKNMTEAAGRVTTAFGLKVVAEYRVRMNKVKGTMKGSRRFFCNEVCFGFPTNNQSRSDSVTGLSKSCKMGYWNGHWESQPLNRLW